MKYTKRQISFMRRALALAKKGMGLTHPNPMAGCVIARDGRIIAEGYHKIFGGLHAEAAAIKNAGGPVNGADLYVTLEPCSKHGKQPPCTDAVIKSGIKRVFIASADKTQSGAEILRKAGIEVFTGLLSKEAKALNKRFFNPGKQKTSVKFAMTLDGKIATRAYDSKWITSAQSRRYVHKLRTRYDGLLVGFNTAIKDNPSLTSHSAGDNPVRIIIDEQLQTPAHYSVLDRQAATVIVCDEKMVRIPPHFVKEGITILKINFPAFKKDFLVLIKALNKIGFKKILVEGGGETISSVLFSKSATDIFAFIAPVIAGGREAVSPVEGCGVEKIKDCLKLKNIKIKKISRDILITGDF